MIGSLDKLLIDPNVMLTNERKIELVRGIARGVFHLHKHNIIHRDLAARNILLTATGDPKISVFHLLQYLFIHRYSLTHTQTHTSFFNSINSHLNKKQITLQIK
jgi:serine/threonine protein kinase